MGSGRDDGPGQHNPVRSEDPWGGGLPILHGVHVADIDLTLRRTIDFRLSRALKAVTNQIAICVCREQT
jgi:hypothetical protein